MLTLSRSFACNSSRTRCSDALSCSAAAAATAAGDVTGSVDSRIRTTKPSASPAAAATAAANGPVRLVMHEINKCLTIALRSATETRRHSWSTNPRRIIAVVSQMCINIGVIVISVKNALIDFMTLTFDLSTPNYSVSVISRILTSSY